ncbi:LysR family transcriptional regulator [Sinorhizobium meliloti]|nr:LysR family transcriptional regulator [Sinorhizobium meliloti]MDW9510788.1 LysR family transcriptional regulator [Sinorhizobium meliloti]
MARFWKVSNLGTPTFEQLRVFLAVVDSGSVAGAACKLNHAVLVITYGVANLKSQLDLELFEHGHAQTATHGRRAVKALQVEVDMAVDVMLPRSGWERCCEPSPKRSDCMSRRSGR